MNHLALLYYGLSFTTGCVSIGIALLIYAQYGKRVILFYVLFLGALALIQASLTVSQYGRLTGLSADPILRTTAEVLDKGGILLFLFSAPFFFDRLPGRPKNMLKQILYLVPGSGIAVMIVLNALLLDSPVLFVVPFVLLYGTTAYCLISVTASFPRLGDRVLKRGLRIFLFVSLGFFPLFVFEILRERFPALAGFDLLEAFALPSYFFTINALSIALSIRLFNQPPYLRGSRLTDHFRESFGITSRETEVISRLARGDSYNRIAEALFISYKTVDNHVRNIYQKTSVMPRKTPLDPSRPQA